MKSRKPLALVGLLLVCGFTIAPATVATASTSAQVLPAVDDWVVAPGGSSSKFREYMLNVTGSVLKGFTPDKWQREMAANANRYNLGGETLNHKYGFDSTGGWANTPPETPAEYAMQRAEFEKTASFTKPDGTKVKGSKPLINAPVTKNAKLSKVAGGAVSVISAGLIGWGGGVAAGKFITNLNGVDPERGLCYPGFEDFGIIGSITGSDCAGLLAFDAEYTANEGEVVGLVGQKVCNPNSPYKCMQLLGIIDYSTPDPRRAFCVQVSPAGSPYVNNMAFAKPDGTAYTSNWVGGSKSTACALMGEGTDAMSPTDFLAVEISGYGFTTGYGTGTWLSPVAGLEELDGDPERFLTCSILGTDGMTYTANSAEYKDSDGGVSAPTCPELPEGVAPANVAIDRNTNGLIDRVQDLEVTDEFVAWWNAYPECRTGGCKLDLVKSTGPLVAASCFDVGDDCADWFESPSKLDDYQCRYGVHTVELSECNVYSGTFKPGRVEVGAPYSDPLTGTWSGGENSPTPDRQALGQPVQNPGMARSCNGMASAGFDPVAWVMRPVQCALEWAFVPRAIQVELQFEAARLAWASTPLMALLDGWGEITDLSFGASGCSGPHFDFSGTLLGDLGYPLDACSGPKAQAASMVSLIIFVSAGLGCLVSVTASIAGVVGMSKPEV